MLHLVDINEDNWRLPLKVREDQVTYVSSPEKLLARAYAYRNLGSRAFYIYDGDIPVGMGLYHDCEALKSYDLSQLFIDERYQGKGYGKASVRLVLDEMKQEGKYDKVVLCYIEGNDAAYNLYRAFGFAQTGVRDGNEIAMSLELKRE